MPRAIQYFSNDPLLSQGISELKRNQRAHALPQPDLRAAHGGLGLPNGLCPARRALPGAGRGLATTVAVFVKTLYVFKAVVASQPS